jgi:hypothetical protein
MRLLFLGYDANHLKVMNIIKKDYVINMVDYDNIHLSSKSFIKSIDEIKLDDYKIIFISELSFDDYLPLFKNYEGKGIIFKGLYKIELDEIKNEMKINYLINELRLKQNICRPNIFICGYNHLGDTLSKRLLLMGYNIRVGVTSKEELHNLLQYKISCIYANNNDAMASLVELNEFIINTTSNEFNPKAMKKIHEYLVDINNYDLTKYYQKTYAPK